MNGLRREQYEKGNENMNIILKEDKFHIRSYFASCACRCKFCCLGDYPKDKRISFDDYEQVMKKFSNVNDRYNMRLRSFIYNCPEHPYLKRQIDLYNSLPMQKDEYTQLDLNGTRVKTDEELGIWFTELIDSGVEKVAFSWFGNEETHDAFVNRKGYCSYLKRCANEAKKRKIPVISKIFLHREILGEIDSVIDEVAQFSDVIICAFMEYSGNAKNMENDFLTIDDYDGLSDRVKEYIGASYLKKFKTEKEWIELSNKGNFPQFNIVDYVLYVDADNINKILTMSNDEIIEEFRKMNKDFQESFGEISELSEQYGDDNCEILYECRDILRKWLDKYYLDHNLDKGKLFSFTNSSVEWKVYERL